MKQRFWIFGLIVLIIICFFISAGNFFTTDGKDTKMDKIVALTFDDGPNTTTTFEVIEKLEKYNVTASFFLIGDKINEESAKAVLKEKENGYEICNHSKTHSFMNTLSAEEIKSEIQFTSEKIKELTGEYPKFFRPPYIVVNETMFDAIDLPFICGINGLDWEPDVPAEKRAQMILDTMEDAAIILMHDLEGNVETVKALDILIPKLLEEGYTFVNISDVFKLRGVTPEVHTGKVYSNALQ